MERGRVPPGDFLGSLGRAPAAVVPLEVRFAHPVRLSPATHSQGKAAEKVLLIA